MVRNLPIARDILEACCRIGKHGRHQIVREHALQLGRHFPVAAAARDGERDGRVPAPARLKHRRVEKCLHEHVARGGRVQVAEDVGEGKGMLRAERQQQRVLGRRRL